ncbi:MAG: ketopantoate reductase family protein [Chloroflexota bacterium]
MNMTGLRVMVMGSGALGGFVGAALARHGCDVTFVARGQQLVALRERGLEIRRDEQVEVLRPLRAVASPTEAPAPVDLVLFMVKNYDLEPAARAVLPVLGPETAVLAFQNGVDAPEQLAAIVGRERVMAGTTTLNVRIETPGVLFQTGPQPHATLGELSGEITARLRRVGQALDDAGFAVRLTADPLLAVWQKFTLFAPHATMTASCQLAIGEIRAVPEGLAMYHQLIEETVAVGRASGIPLPADQVEQIYEFVLTVGPKIRSSMANDFAAGRRVELEYVTGAMVRRGRALGVPTPGFSALYSVLKVRALASGSLTPAPTVA